MTIMAYGIHERDYFFVAEIYKQGIESGNATFETEVPSWSKWDQSHLSHSRILAKEEGIVLGWAALSPVSGRCVYGGVAEVSVYINNEARGKGIGSVLLGKLVEESEKNGIWTLQAGIFPENLGSLRIHEKCGFRLVGVREKLGRMNGIWRDVCLLERRSQIAGKE
jgi:phosphinothricin acetyltransferase